MTGVAHTAAAQNLGAFPYAAAQTLGAFPYAAAQTLGGFPYAQNPYWTQNGLGHTANTVGQEFVTDPFVTTRIAQTFPFVSWGYSPFNWNV
jgi:hypothetical protein